MLLLRKDCCVGIIIYFVLIFNIGLDFDCVCNCMLRVGIWNFWVLVFYYVIKCLVVFIVCFLEFGMLMFLVDLGDGY